MSHPLALLALFVVLSPLIPLPKCQGNPDVSDAIDVIQQVDDDGYDHRAVATAIAELQAAPISAIAPLLDAMQPEKPIANNWLRAAVESVTGHANESELPQLTASLQSYVEDRDHVPTARFTAFRLLETLAPDSANALIPSLHDDSSLDLRRIAIAQMIEQAESYRKTAPDGESDQNDTSDDRESDESDELPNSEEGSQAPEKTKTRELDADEQQAVAIFRSALASARDADQLQKIANALESLGQDVDLTEIFGFIGTWRLIGPFDNSNGKGFDAIDGPESSNVLSADETYEGKDEQVRWKVYTTDSEFGVVDINKAIGRHKGATVYAWAEFESDQTGPIELRLGCINAHKVWLNGKLLISNEVYHTGMDIDQYIGRGERKSGRNDILVKICQNEQEEAWAQQWQFQLRACDHLGTAIPLRDD